jgi:hypothetical protein
MMLKPAMKKSIVLVVLFLAAHGLSFAQSGFPELDKIKQIKLLESTREDVKRIFGAFEFEDDEDGEDQIDIIYTEHLAIRFSYALGNCSDEDDEEWNVAKGKVTEISLFINDPDESPELKIDLSKLERIDRYKPDEDDDPDDFVYFDKNENVSYGLSDGKINTVMFTPGEKDFPALCNNETVREFASNKEWLIEKLKKGRFFISSHSRPAAHVDELSLSKYEFTPDCPASDSSEAEGNSDYAEIEVATKGFSTDPTDVLTYNYTVSGGKIVGSGANVVWDLSGVKPGSYTITAGVDNGCGVCGATKTVVVIIREPNCPQKEK